MSRRSSVIENEVHAGALQQRQRDKAKQAALMSDGVTAVMRRVYAHIQLAADKGRTSCTFEVPLGLIGYAPYELAPCIEQLMTRLTACGYAIEYVFPRALFVYWHGSDSPPQAPDAPQQQPEPEPVVPPDRPALGQLDTLRNQPVPDQGRSKATKGAAPPFRHINEFSGRFTLPTATR